MDKSVNYLEILGISREDCQDSSLLVSKRDDLLKENLETFNKGLITDEQFNENDELINEAFDVLSDEDKRNEFFKELDSKDFVNYLDILGLSIDEVKLEDESVVDSNVKNAYDEKMEALDELRNSDAYKEEDINTAVKDVQEAYAVLSDPDKRAEFLAKCDELVQRGVLVVEEEEDEKTAGKGRKILKGIGISILVVAILAGATWLGITAYNEIGKLFNKDLSGKDDAKDNSYEIVQETVSSTTTTEALNEEGIVTTTTNADIGTDTTQEATEEENNDITVPYVGIKNVGDISDKELMNNRVQALSDYFAKAGIYNNNTNSPYTPEEIRDIILFVNGAYVAENWEVAELMLANQINFIVSNINSERNIYTINYMANSDVIDEEQIKSYISAVPSINYVEELMCGDSHCYPYLHWLNERYNAMVSTTDKDKSREIYAEIAQSLADLMEGDGYKLGDVTYKRSDFESKGNVNEGNMLMMLVNMYSCYTTKYINKNYVVHKGIAGDISLTVDQIYSQFDGVCPDDMLIENGYVIGNFADHVKLNTMSDAIANAMTDTTDYYDGLYTPSRGR